MLDFLGNLILILFNYLFCFTIIVNNSRQCFPSQSYKQIQIPLDIFFIPHTVYHLFELFKVIARRTLIASH